MLLFIIGGDLLSPNSSILNVFDKDAVGEINGNAISLQEFSTQVNETSDKYAMNLGRRPNETEMDYVRVEAFNELIYKLGFQKEYDKLGLNVTPEELEDMIQGNNIHPDFARQFTNQQTGEVDRNAIITYLKQLNTLPAEQQAFFRFIEKSIATERMRKKYSQMMALSEYATKQEAQQFHQDQNSKRTIKYVYVPFTSIADSTIKPSDAELQTYFNQHRSDYKRKENRAIEYVSFSFLPSGQDTADVKKAMAGLTQQLASAEDAESFVSANSDIMNPVRDFKTSELPTTLVVDSLAEGSVFGPYLEGNSFVSYRVLSTQDDSAFSARASHILFAFGADKAKAKEEAEKILKQLQEGADFGLMANMYSQDPGTKQRGGDLGWFAEKAMVPEFDKAVMNATKAGIVPSLVETSYGFHIINVTGLKTKKKYRLAALGKEITSTDRTRNAAYAAAGNFAKARTVNQYFDKVKEAKVISIQALTIPRDARNINNLTGNEVREVVRWAYNDAKKGDISQVFQLSDQFIVAMLREAAEDGEPALNDVRDEVLANYRKEQKAKQISDKLAKLSGSLEDIKKNYGDKAELVEMPDLTMMAATVRMASYAPKAIGNAFAINKGERAKAFADESGVFVVEVVATDDAAEIADYNAYKKQIAERRAFQVDDKLMKAIKKLANVKDNTAKYF